MQMMSTLIFFKDMSTSSLPIPSGSDVSDDSAADSGYASERSTRNLNKSITPIEPVTIHLESLPYGIISCILVFIATKEPSLLPLIITTIYLASTLVCTLLSDRGICALMSASIIDRRAKSKAMYVEVDKVAGKLKPTLRFYVKTVYKDIPMAPTILVLPGTAYQDTGTQTDKAAEPQLSEESRRSKAQRNRIRRTPIDPHQRVPTPIISEIVYVLREFSPQSLSELRTAWLSKHNEYPSMPPSHPQSIAATNREYDHGACLIADTIFTHGQEIRNPFNWTETTTPHVYISMMQPGVWLINAADDVFYMFYWLLTQNIWYCSKHGIAICLEDNGSVTVLHGLDPNMIVWPPIYGGQQHLPGPYWEEAVTTARNAIEAKQYPRREEEAYVRMRDHRNLKRAHVAQTLLRDQMTANEKRRWEKVPPVYPRDHWLPVESDVQTPFHFWYKPLCSSGQNPANFPEPVAEQEQPAILEAAAEPPRKPSAEFLRKNKKMENRRRVFLAHPDIRARVRNLREAKVKTMRKESQQGVEARRLEAIMLEVNMLEASRREASRLAASMLEAKRHGLERETSRQQRSIKPLKRRTARRGM